MLKARYAQALLIPILLLALALRMAPWGQNRFLEDEALYAYWGLQIATGADPMLDAEPVDKPPLHPYLLALTFLLASPLHAGGSEAGASSSLLAGETPPGVLETAARLPSLFASLAAIALVYALGRHLYGDACTGLVAALLLALSPFDILFASTAFTDPLMTALTLAALLAVAKGRWAAAGLLSGLAFATKQQALFYLPLLVAIGWLIARGRSRPARSESQPGRPAIDWLRGAGRLPWLRFGLAFALVAGGVICWDLARLQRPGFFEQSLISYGGLAPARTATLGERAAGWLALVADFWVSPWLNLLLLAVVGLWIAGSALRREFDGPNGIDLALLLFLLAYLLLHWLIGFQVWDRYLLGIVPLLALLLARALVALGAAVPARPWRRIYALASCLILVLGLAGPVVQAAHSELPVGGDHGAYDGIQELAAYIRANAPPGSVLYHHWLGYHYRFYLYGAPLRLHWYPDLDDLTRDTTVYRRESRYIAFPSWRDSAPVVDALARAHVELLPVFETRRCDGDVSFRLYRLEGP